METFNKLTLSKIPIENEALLNKNDFIRFLKTEKAFNNIEKLNNFHEDTKSQTLFNMYNRFRNEIKVKKYVKKLKFKIENNFLHNKPYLEKLEKMDKNLPDLQKFEKNVFNVENISDVESDDSDYVRYINRQKNLKKKNQIKVNKISKNKKNFGKEFIDVNKFVNFMKNNEGNIERYLNFMKYKKESRNDLEVIIFF